MVMVYGTDSETLKRGPGLDQRTSFPGQGRLIYIAGHRTTYAAPFSDIDRLRSGDAITLEMPYGTFTYRVTRSIVVPSTRISVLRSRGREEVALQACHPRFFASHRWITYGRLVETSAPHASGSEATG
jgi:sortase A